jgi:hypothetical protein
MTLRFLRGLDDELEAFHIQRTMGSDFDDEGLGCLYPHYIAVPRGHVTLCVTEKTVPISVDSCKMVRSANLESSSKRFSLVNLESLLSDQVRTAGRNLLNRPHHPGAMHLIDI